MVRRVGDRQEAVGAQAVGEEVVQHAAVLAAQHAVLRAADGQLRHVVGEDALEVVEGLRAAGLDLAHVRDVEDAARAAHGHVLGPHALVLDGHLPAREGHEAGARLGMASVQRSALQRRGRGRGRPPRRTLATRARPSPGRAGAQLSCASGVG